MGPSLELAIVAGEALRILPLPSTGEVTIGRDPECDVRIEDRSISRRHAILHLGEDLRVQDLGGVSGTRVRVGADPGGTPLLRRLSGEEACLSVGDRVHFGTVVVAIQRTADSVTRMRSFDMLAMPIVLDHRMRVVYDQARRAAREEVDAVLVGEPGVGKRSLARRIHLWSARAHNPYLTIACGSVRPSLLGEGPAGAAAWRGALDPARGGTVLLEEIGDLPLSAQRSLCRVIEERDRGADGIDVRLLASTSRDLGVAMEPGGPLEALLRRLDGARVAIPPLRERPAEIPPLCVRFLAEADARLDRPSALSLSHEALHLLERHPFPGNVRELRDTLLRAAILCEGEVIGPEHLPRRVLPQGAPRT